VPHGLALSYIVELFAQSRLLLVVEQISQDSLNHSSRILSFYICAENNLQVFTNHCGHFLQRRKGKIDEMRSDMFRVIFLDGQQLLTEYFKSIRNFDLVKCPHTEPGPGFVPERGIMD
jgi:hypothetical protein